MPLLWLSLVPRAAAVTLCCRLIAVPCFASHVLLRCASQVLRGRRTAAGKLKVDSVTGGGNNVVKWVRRHRQHHGVRLPERRGITHSWFGCVPLRDVVGRPVIVEDEGKGLTV